MIITGARHCRLPEPCIRVTGVVQPVTGAITMNWITSSLRNKILLIAGTGTVLVVGSALYGFSEIWHGIRSLQDLAERLATDSGTTQEAALALQQIIDEERHGVFRLHRCSKRSYRVQAP